jgi:hypothetical protein
MLEFLSKIEATYNKIVFKGPDVISERNIDSTADMNSFSETTAQEISPFLKNLEIGSIIPLRCGHNGMLSREEIETYRSFLVINNFII